jgi:glycosyltransferase involved in cell wall biosynthesis
MEYYQKLRHLRTQLDVEEEVKFVFESGPTPGENYFIGRQVVSDLYRVADALLMTSRREGFGMPNLEAGLTRLPIISTPMPAINELVEHNAFVFSHTTTPPQLAYQILSWIRKKPEHNLRVKVRQNYTWEAIFTQNIIPLLEMKE